jgi:hypothetical protein
MIDLASFSAALGSAKVVLEIGRSINDANVSRQVVSAIIDPKYKLLDVQGAALQLQEENQNLRKQLDAVNDGKEFRESLEFQRTRYHRKTDKGEEVYCSQCLDVDGKRVRIGRANEGFDYTCEAHGYRR